MSKENSFDIVSVIEIQEVVNAVNQAMMEIRQRFDFKGSKSDIKLEEKDKKIVLISDDEHKMKSVTDILQSKLIKRGVSLKSLIYGKVEPAAGGTVRQVITLQQGIPVEKAKEIVKVIKDTKLKIQSQIQNDQIRVFGKSKDDLQSIMGLLRGKDLGIDLQFINYR